MCRICQSFVLFFLFVFQFNYTLGNQSHLQMNPCDLMFHARDISQDIYPEISDFTLSRISLPVEFHLNDSIPEQHRPIIREAASEWNTKSEQSLITISDEIDESQWNTAQQNQSSRNIIYWLTEDQYNIEDITERNNTLMLGGKTFFQPYPYMSPSIPYIFIHNTYIIIYGESHNFMNLARWIFSVHLEVIGIKPPENTDALGLQRIFVKRLSEINDDEFYNMIIEVIKDKEITPPSDKPEEIQEWFIREVNAEIENIQPLTSFEDLRALMIEEYSLDIVSTSKNSSVILKNRMLHEFGHAFGLDHNEKPGSLMYDGRNMTPVPYFPKNHVVPKHVDDLALHGLSCSPFSEIF